MPWTPSQVRAIGAKMRAQGKSPAEISAFFRKHGVDRLTPGDKPDGTLKKKLRGK